MTAGLETLRTIHEDKNFYKNLNKNCEYLYQGISDTLEELSLKYTFNSQGSMFTLFFTQAEVTDFDSAKTSDTKLFTAFFNRMLEGGVYLPPSQFEACFVSAAHTRQILDKTIKAIRSALYEIHRR